MNTGQQKSAEILGRLLAELSRDAGTEGIGGSMFDRAEHGAAMNFHLANGDRFRVSIEWLGDDEAAA
jgi:hypothetical protein